MNPAAHVFNKHAQLYHERFGDVSLYREGLDILCNRLTDDAKVLDIACGPGNISRYLLDRKPRLDVLGIDLAPAMVEIAGKVNPEAKFDVMDSRNTSNLDRKFDAVVCAFLLPYLSPDEASQLIRDITMLLNEGGVLYVSTMVENDDNVSGIRVSSKGDALFQHYHKKEFVEGELIAGGYLISYNNVIEYPAPDGKKTSDLVMIAKKSRPFYSGSLTTAAR